MQGRAPTRFAVMTAAIGEVLQQTLPLPKPLSLAFALICVGFLSWRGSSSIEKAKTWGSAALYLGYCAFALLVLTAPVEAAAAHPPAAAPDVRPWDVVISAALYVAYNVAVVPAVLFCLHRQTRRSETFSSGALAGVAMTVPFALTLACLLRFPQSSVMDAEVPWLPMITTAADGDEPEDRDPEGWPAGAGGWVGVAGGPGPSPHGHRSLLFQELLANHDYRGVLFARLKWRCHHNASKRPWPAVSRRV